MTTASALLPLLQRAQMEAVGRGDELETAIRCLVAAVERFGDKPVAQFTTKVKAIKPSAQRTKTAPPPLLGEALALRNKYSASLGNLQQSKSVINQIEALKKPDVVAIAASIGLRITSKTTKASALKYLTSTAAQAERDRGTAARIRIGA